MPLLGCLALLPLLPGCRSAPAQRVSVSSRSSLLAVDVLFPTPLGRDPDLVQVFLVRGPIHRGLTELPELIPASFVKHSRAYLLDPEPGTYSLVAVSSAVAAPLSDYPVAGGVRRTTLPGTIANATIFPSELIQRTRTTVGPGSVAFMGALRVVGGDRIDADAGFQDELQKRLADRIRPGASSESGLSSWFTLAWMPDLEKTTLDDGPSTREAFLTAAISDLGESPWAEVIARARPIEDALAAAGARPTAPARTRPTASAQPEPSAAAPGPNAQAPEPNAQALEPDSGAQEPETQAQEPNVVVPEPRVAPQQPEVAPQPPRSSPPRQERRRVAGIPPESPLARIEIGMPWEEVREILGEPDGRFDHTTSKAWIPFYTGPGAYLRDWIYEGQGRVVFSLHHGTLEVQDVVYDPGAKQ